MAGGCSGTLDFLCPKEVLGFLLSVLLSPWHPSPSGRRGRPQQCHGHPAHVCQARLCTTCLLTGTGPFVGWAAGLSLSLFTKAWSARLRSACEHSSWALSTENSLQGAETRPPDLLCSPSRATGILRPVSVGNRRLGLLVKGLQALLP